MTSHAASTHSALRGQSPHVDSYGVDHFHLYGRKHGSNRRVLCGEVRFSVTRSARSGQVCRLTAADLPPNIPLSAHHLCPLLSSCHSSSVPAFLVSRCPLALTAADQLRAQVVAAVSCFHPPSCCLCVCLCLSACVRALMPYTTPSPWWLLCLQWSVDPPLARQSGCQS